MATVLTDKQPADVGFAVNMVTTTAGSCVTVKAAPGAGKAICLERFVAVADADMTLTVGDGNSGVSVTVAALGQLYLLANVPAAYVFRRPLVLTANAVLAVMPSTIGDELTVFVEGYVQ